MTDSTASLPFPGIIETVTSKHIIDCISSSISDDGSTAMIVFKVAGYDGAKDEKFAATIPVDQLPWLRAIMHDTLSKIPPSAKAPLGENTVVFGSRGPAGVEQIDVAVTEDQKIIMRLCPGRAEEMPWLITLDTALRLAALLNEIPTKLKGLQRAK